MDSGAVDHVMPKGQCKEIKVDETEASRKGRHYQAANGSQIKNYGERKLIGEAGKGIGSSIKMQVADVTKALGAVTKLCDAGNRVIFDNEGSFVENKTTEIKTEIKRDNGTYTMDFWVKKSKDNMGIQAIGSSFHGPEDRDI